MAKYREKLAVVIATQWFKNGDHPKDNCHPISLTNSDLSEGEVVRYYRTPEFDGQDRCCHCGDIMHNHGWIDSRDGDCVVCPGDWIITGTDGEFYSCNSDVFATIYELADDNEVKQLRNERDECRKILEKQLDRDKDPDDSLRDLVVLACNALYWAKAEKKHFVMAELQAAGKVVASKTRPGRAQTSYRCPKCGKYGVEWDARAKVLRCLYTACNLVIRIEGQKSEPSPETILEAIESEKD